MTAILVSAKGVPEAIRHLRRLRDNLSLAAIDGMVDTVALKVFAELVQKTPKRWFGQVRRAWTIRRPHEGGRVILNTSKIMLFLEEGTANGGAGYIYPRVKKLLYIPLTASAASGWRPGLERGRDYLLAPRVKGIKPLHIVSDENERAQGLLLDGMLKLIREGLKAAHA